MKIMRFMFLAYAVFILLFLEIPSTINWILNGIPGRTVEYQILALLCIVLHRIMK